MSDCEKFVHTDKPDMDWVCVCGHDSDWHNYGPSKPGGPCEACGPFVCKIAGCEAWGGTAFGSPPMKCNGYGMGAGCTADRINSEDPGDRADREGHGIPYEADFQDATEVCRNGCGLSYEDIVGGKIRTCQASR